MTIGHVAGYKAKLRYEGFVDDSSQDFWVDVCCDEVHPVGWCARQGNSLTPPKAIETKYSDWKEFLLKRLTGARTLPANFHYKIMESLRCKFRSVKPYCIKFLNERTKYFFAVFFYY